MFDASKTYDPSSHITWLEFATRLPKDEYDELTKRGWRWSGRRKQFYCNYRVPTYPTWLTTIDGGTVAFAAERAERLEASATLHQAKGDAALARGHAMMDVIPFGQPIMIGHYSEGRDRRYRGKIDRTMRRAFDEHDTAKALQSHADASERHQTRLHRPDVIARRIARLEAEKCPRDDDAIAKAKAELASLGGLPFDQLDIKKGDYVLALGEGRCKVLKVCKVNLSCLHLDSPFFMRLYPKGYPLGKEKVLRKLTEAEIVTLLANTSPEPQA